MCYCVTKIILSPSPPQPTIRAITNALAGGCNKRAVAAKLECHPSGFHLDIYMNSIERPWGNKYRSHPVYKKISVNPIF